MHGRAVTSNLGDNRISMNIRRRLKTAVEIVTRGGGIDSVTIIAYAASGHFAMCADTADAERLARRLRLLATEIESGTRQASLDVVGRGPHAVDEETDGRPTKRTGHRIAGGAADKPGDDPTGDGSL